MKRRGHSLHDWDALEREWLASDHSLNAFRKLKKIGNEKNFYKQVSDRKWIDKKKRIEEVASAIVEKKLGKQTADEWERQIRLLTAIESQVATLLRNCVDKNGKITRPMEPLELKALAETVSKSVAARKNIKGEGGGDPENPTGTTNISLHATFVKIGNEIEAENDTPTLLTPPPPLIGNRSRSSR